MATASHHLMWNMTRRCNFQCRYCYFPHEAGPVEHVLPAAAILEFLDATGEEWVVGMTGGEPFLYPDFVDLCLALTGRHRISIDTNLSLSRQVRDFATRVDPSRVHDLYIALHIEERRRKGLVEAFVADVRLLQDRGFHLAVNYVVHPALVEEFHAHREFFAREGVALTPRPFKGFHDGLEYPNSYGPEARAIFADHPRAGRKLAFNFQGVPCLGGRNFLRLEPDGSLYRCAGEKRPMGHILHAPRRLETAEPCRARRCPCLGVNYVLPSPAQAHLLDGLRAAVTGDAAAARLAFCEALHADPCLAAAAANLGWLDWEEGDLVSALGRFGQALELDDGSEVHAGNLAALLCLQGDRRQAMEVLANRLEPAWQSLLPPLLAHLDTATAETLVHPPAGWPRLCVDMVPEHARTRLGLEHRVPAKKRA